MYCPPQENKMEQPSEEQLKAFFATFSQMQLDRAQLNHQIRSEAQQEFELVYNELGDEYVFLLLMALADKQSRLVWYVKQQMLNNYYSVDEVNRLVQRFNSAEFASIRAQKAAVARVVGTDSMLKHKADEQVYLQELKAHFLKSSPIKAEQLLKLARTIEESDCSCFENPSQSIRDSWGSDNQKWKKLCFAAIELSKSVTHQDALSHYRWLCYARHEIAILLNHKRGDAIFGQLRMDGLFKYGLRPHLFTLITRQDSSGFADQFAFCDQALKSLESAPDTDNVKHKTIKINGSSKNITIILDPVTKTALTQFYRSQICGIEHIIVGHAVPIRTDTMFNANIQPLYSEIFKTDDIAVIYKLLGKIFWYLSPIAACDAGSAAATLMYTYDILNRKNLPLTHIVGDISPDLLGIFQPDVEKFSDDFRDLLTQRTTNTLKKI